MKTKLKVVPTKQQTVIEQLADKGFEVTEIDIDTFKVVSLKTGAVVERQATSKDLNKYLVCMSYINDRHGAEVNAYKYIQPAHA